ncbi:MAG: DNA methyltransferase [Candidatus Portnoybacteria bacterium]|nr:DNA methyltransferase [Candidatus Portnoybacteria bacterium]MDD4983014.1 DNA methyltransferase [Candidatus Portnoybacteria bacterium]
MDKENKIKIVYVPTDSLHGNPINPRYWSDEATKKLTKSIQRFNITEPLLVNCYSERKNQIISGHFRWTIAKKLDIKIVPVIFLNIQSAKKEQELLLRMNANQGAWDKNLFEPFDLNMLLDVFSSEDLSNIWDENLEVEDDDFQIEKEIEKARETDIKPGDMFSLGGQHKLYCADSTKLETIKKIAGKSKANIINNDIPFNIGLPYSAGISGKRNYGGNTNDKKTYQEYRLFVKSLLENGLSVCHEDCHVFMWLDEKYIGMMQELYKELEVTQKRLCFWIKGNQNPTPQVAFNKTTELCLYGTRGAPFLSYKIKNLNEVLNKEMSTGNRLIEDILDMLDIWLVKRLPTNQYEHPTEKPPSLYEKSIRRCSKPGEIILDMTAGSGSLMMACEQLKRTAYLVEIEPIFCQVIINRYEKISDKKAERIN